MTDETLFIAALEKATSAERRAFLDEACGGDVDLRDRVERLLAGHGKAAGILDQSVVLPESMHRHIPPAERPGMIFAGRYKLLEEIGAGGMGAVWVAEQIQPVRRKVAVKLIKAGMDSKSVLARFEAERQALALMDHPHIAKVFDGGMTDAGRPFFVMEYVKGVPLTTYCDNARLNISDRLALFVPVCQAVQHAHQKGIIHRDLKPSNILICLYDGLPVPKVIDFGLAKAMHQPLTEHTLHTAHGLMLGTPLYMSPEQAEINNLDVDTRTDVYALGVILYELLTGTTPLERDRLRLAAWDEMLRIIREEDPPRPSTRLSGGGSLPSVAAQRQLEPVRLTKLVRGELDWIVMKCLEKNRGRRYDTANGLARDIQRYLADEPVEACPPSAVYRLQKAARKYRVPLATAVMFTGLLVAGVVGLAIALAKVNHEREAKEAALSAKETALQAEGMRRKQTRAALDVISSQITEDWLASQPVLSPQHKQFLGQALRQYEEFATDTGQDEESRAGVANAYWRVGSIRERLADWKDAEGAWEQCRTLSSTLATSYPDHPAHRDMHARVLHRLGNLYSRTGRPREALTFLVQSRTVYQGLVTDFPAEPEYQAGLGITLETLGMSYKNLNQFTDARESYHHALDIFRPLTARSPSDPQLRFHLAQTLMNSGILQGLDSRPREEENSHRHAVDHFSLIVAGNPTLPRYVDALATGRSNLADVFRIAGKHAEAEKVFHQSLAGRRKLVAEFPAVPDYRRGLAITLNNLALLFRDTDRAEKAEACSAEAEIIHKKLAEDFPAGSNHQNEAAGALNGSARLRLARKDYAGARRLLEEALPYHRAALKANPNHPAYRKFYRLTRWRLSEAFLGLKDHAAAAENVDEFLRYATEPPRDHYTAATLLADCARLAAHDERLTEIERQLLAASYGDRAITALRRAMELKAQEVVQMRTDAVLNSLRSRDDFKTLLAEWEKENPPKREVLPAPRGEG